MAPLLRPSQPLTGVPANSLITTAKCPQAMSYHATPYVLSRVMRALPCWKQRKLFSPFYIKEVEAPLI